MPVQKAQESEISGLRRRNRTVKSREVGMVDLERVKSECDEICREYLIKLGIVHDEEAELKSFLVEHLQKER